MIWFYERRGTFIRCETRDVPAGTNLFELLIIEADGTERVERFADSESMVRRQQELQQTLTQDGWSGPFGRTI